MATSNSNTQLTLFDSLSSMPTDSDLQKAWHLLSLLLSLGRFTSPDELASRCSLFPASSDFVRFLCSIPNSPITLTASPTEGILVTLSLLGLLAFRRFASSLKSIDRFWIGAPTAPSTVMLLKDPVRMYFRKRKRIKFDSLEADDEKIASVSPCAKRSRICSSKVDFQMSEYINRSVHVHPDFMSIKLNNIILPTNLFIKINSDEFIYKLKDVIHAEDETGKRVVAEPNVDERSVCPRVTCDGEAVCEEAKAVDEMNLESRMNIDEICFKDDIERTSLVPALCVNAEDACNAEDNCFTERAEANRQEEGSLSGSVRMQFEVGSLLKPINTALLGMSRQSKRSNELAPLDEEHITTHSKNEIFFPSFPIEYVGEKQLPKPSAKMKLTFGDATSPRKQAVNQYVESSKTTTTPKENCQVKRNLTAISMGQKSKPKHENTHIKEGKRDASSVSHMDKVQRKDLPSFESYIVEEEEGSGGYGTVYRARRKSDGAIVAIKCPHENAHRHHINNELRMLERVGGKNFIIKYEGRFKSGNSDCFVLEHVEHDRPEVLKKDIDLFHLRWYGFCMFKALASLHKQGIVHRDVKPGNFLFSRKSNKGYLIDFNLAMDLRQKYGTTNKLKMGNDQHVKPTIPPNAKSAPPTKSRRLPDTKFLGVINRDATKRLKPTSELKNQNGKSMNRSKADNGLNIMRSQGAEGSGITSLKDMTSTRTPSAERLREPLPCQGRKELISLLQEAMHSPNYEVSSVPASVRKRVAAPPGKVDERPTYLTPMPLHSTGIAIPGNTSRDGKPKKEGPCCGTKGFRAPEVLFRSTHQGPKVDVWSAGVTLLYLIIGRTPFYGDPEQNIKDIVKLRGSEDLWEVSKLHDRESSFPLELYNVESLPSITLREWCKINTKRRDFLDMIPSSLIDLVDKCLMVNPRLRISAEDALKHEFFAPCRENLRKQRMQRQGHCLDSESNLPSREQSIESKMPVTLKISHQQT